MAADAAEIREERAARRCERGVDGFPFRRRALRDQECGEVRRALVDLSRLAGKDARHERVRADGVRIVDPRGEEGLVKLRAECVEGRGVLREFRHALAARGQRGIGVARGAAELGEEQPPLAPPVALIRRRVARECHRRHGLAGKLLRRPHQPHKGVAGRRARVFREEFVPTLVELHRGAVGHGLAIDRERELPLHLRAEGVIGAQRGEDLALPFRGERAGLQEWRGGLAGGDVERDEAGAARVARAARGEAEREARRGFRRRVFRVCGERKKDGEEEAGDHGGGGFFMAMPRSPQALGSTCVRHAGSGVCCQPPLAPFGLPSAGCHAPLGSPERALKGCLPLPTPRRSGAATSADVAAALCRRSSLQIPRRFRKFVPAGRRNQHPGRVCSPEKYGSGALTSPRRCRSCRARTRGPRR